MGRIPERALRMAERTVHITMEDARALPGFLGRLCTAHLRGHGWYAVTMVDNGSTRLRTLYLLDDTTQDTGLPCEDCGATSTTPCDCDREYPAGRPEGEM